MDPSPSRRLTSEELSRLTFEELLRVTEQFLAEQREQLIEAGFTKKKLTDANIIVGIQNLPPSISPTKVDYDLQNALRKRLREMNNTRINYSHSPFHKLWFIYWINLLAQGVFGVFLFGGRNEWVRLFIIWFSLMIVFFWVDSLISAHTRRKREIDFAWLKDLEKNSPLVRHFSNLETAKAKKKKEDDDRTAGYVLFFVMFLMLIISVVIIKNICPNKDSMALTPVHMFLTAFPVFFTIYLGLFGMLTWQTNLKWKRRVLIISSIALAFFLFFLAYCCLSTLWSWYFILLFPSLLIGYWHYCFFWSVLQEEDKCCQLIEAEQV